MALPRRSAAQERAANRRWWGAECGRGEVLNVGSKVAKRMVQRYLWQALPPRAHVQSWAIFLRNHASDSWARCPPDPRVCVHALCTFIITAHCARRSVPVAVTPAATDASGTPHLRAAPPCGQAPPDLAGDPAAPSGSRVTAGVPGPGVALLVNPASRPTGARGRHAMAGKCAPPAKQRPPHSWADASWRQG